MEQEQKSIYLEIAEELNLGQVCYYNKKLKDFFCIPDTDDLDADLFTEERKRIKNEKKDLIILRQPHSRVTFLLMEEFIQGIDDFEIQSELIEAISFDKPFARFKQKARNYKIEGDWCKFRDAKHAEIIEKEIGS